MTNATTAIKTVNFDLYAEAFIGYTRRKYTEQYTQLPTSSYAEALKPAMEAFAKAMGVDEAIAPLTIISSEGYAQRLICPRVYLASEGNLVIRYDRELIPIIRTEAEGEVSFSAGKASVRVTTLANQLVLQVELPKGFKVIVPFHTKYQETPTPVLALQEMVEGGNYEQVSDAPGAGGSTSFSALKNLPEGKYRVLSTELKTGGKFGPKVKLTLENPADAEILCSVSINGSWAVEAVAVSKGAKLVVDANTSVARSLQGLVLKADDNVLLDIYGRRVDEVEGKTYVDCALDFSASATYSFKDF